MCLAIPMRVVKIDGDWAISETGGLRHKANISLIRDLRIGDYVIVHAGFAIEKVKESEAKKTLEVLKNIDEIHR